jgi:GT2 family glycosyltransferase
VSIIIPTKDKAEILAVCLQTLVGRTRYRPFEVVLVDTGSRERTTERLYGAYRSRSGFSIVSDPGSFNFSRACNTGARAARGSRLLFLNNDTEILHEDWLDRMAQWLDDPGVGAVGARLLYPDTTLQHAGVVVGMGGLASHLFHQQHKGVSGIFGQEHWYRNLSAVTAACLLTSRQAFDSVGGFDETLELVYGDTEYCLRLRQIGLRIVYSPDAELVHYESQSRGKSVPRADFVRFSERLFALGALDGDPYFNPGLSLQSTRPRLRLGSLDDPKVLNRRLMSGLPRRPTIIVPDDLS